jgi:hypothetical protein
MEMFAITRAISPRPVLPHKCAVTTTIRKLAKRMANLVIVVARVFLGNMSARRNFINKI